MVKLDTLRRVAERSFDAARQAGSLALTTARRVAEPIVERRRSGAGDGSPAPPAPSARPRPAEPPIGDVARAAAPPASPAPEPATTPAAADASEPEHVDREAVIVAESSDPGATGNVGAQIHIDEPWPGYDELNVKQVNAELSEAAPGTLALVRVYESANKNRSTVLDTIDRRLAAAVD